MNLRHLRYFLAVAEEGHFGRAAQRLNIVQPALSMQIRALEEELGGPLFERTSRRVQLTHAGVLLKTEARRTLDQIEHATRTVQCAIRGETGSVRVGFAGNAVVTGRLMSDLRAFHKAYPLAELVVREMAPQAQADAIVAGQLDLGYAPDHGLALQSELIAEHVGVWQLVVAMQDEHPLAKAKCLTATNLIAEPLILYAGHDADDGLLTALRHAAGAEPKVIHRASDTLSVLALAASGLGLALVPASLTHITIPNVVYIPLDAPELTTDLKLISRTSETSGAVCAFLAQARGNKQSG
ncbi:LysR substrate-binding domain-containing protein [Paraburkholderia sediminicola]|uniref:LysR substrate-binding domain-containing protein n=1 Tax=Paraburkholderia sediminicola TaxID=458836 RepID=UPI0038BC3D7D